MKKLAKKWPILLLVAFLAIQLYRPEENTSVNDDTVAFLKETAPSQEVKILLKETCYDCHSNHTRYPWYSHIAPISFWMADHIEEGKEHLNFSIWDSYSVKKKDHKLEEIIETIEEGEMPLREYTWTHSTARLTPEQRQAVIAWAERVREPYQVTEMPQ